MKTCGFCCLHCGKRKGQTNELDLITQYLNVSRTGNKRNIIQMSERRNADVYASQSQSALLAYFIVIVVLWLLSSSLSVIFVWCYVCSFGPIFTKFVFFSF